MNMDGDKQQSPAVAVVGIVGGISLAIVVIFAIFARSQMAIAGWIGFVEGVGQYWAPRHEIPREVRLLQIVACLQTSLRGAGVNETILASLD